MKVSSVSIALLYSSFAFAGLLNPRQESTASGSASVTPTAASSSTSAPVSSASSSTAELGISISFTSPSATLSSTGTSSGAASTASATTPSSEGGCSQQMAQTSHDSNNYTGPVSLCGIEGGNNTLFVGDNKLIQWWTGAFPAPGATVTIQLKWMDGSNNYEWNATDIAAYKGQTLLSVESSYLNGGSSAFYRMILREDQPDGTPVEVIGPVVTFLVPNTNPKPPPPTSFNLLGLVIGLPVALAVVAGVLLIFCCVTKKHRSVFSKIRLPTRRRGYGVRQSRRQRTGNAVDEFDFDASAPIYRDEPGEDYSSSTRDERSARAMGVFSAERNLHSTY